VKTRTKAVGFNFLFLLNSFSFCFSICSPSCLCAFVAQNIFPLRAFVSLCLLLSFPLRVFVASLLLPLCVFVAFLLQNFAPSCLSGSYFFYYSFSFCFCFSFCCAFAAPFSFFVSSWLPFFFLFVSSWLIYITYSPQSSNPCYHSL
jgi:hypothetical protein